MHEYLYSLTLKKLRPAEDLYSTKKVLHTWVFGRILDQELMVAFYIMYHCFGEIIFQQIGKLQTEIQGSLTKLTVLEQSVIVKRIDSLLLYVTFMLSKYMTIKRRYGSCFIF